MDAIVYVIAFLIIFILFILPFILGRVRSHLIYSDSKIKCKACKGEMEETACKLYVLPISHDDTHVQTAKYYMNKAVEISDESHIPTGRHASRIFLLRCQNCGARKFNVVDFLKVRDSEIFKDAADYSYEELADFFYGNNSDLNTENRDYPDKSTTPDSPAEKWITATYAIWSEYAMDSWKYLSGVSGKSRETISGMQKGLENSWSIRNRQELLKEVEALKGDYLKGDTSDNQTYYAGWDLCRACQILGMGYVADLIDREEMVRESVKVVPLMRQYFSSWNDLYSSYLTGYRSWREYYDTEFDSEAEKDINRRAAIARELLSAPDGPCSLDWNMKF